VNHRISLYKLCDYKKDERKKIFNLIYSSKEDKKIRNNCVSCGATKTMKRNFFLALSDSKEVKRIFTFALLMHKTKTQIKNFFSYVQ